MITIGIDPHKSSLTAVAIGSTTEPAAAIRMPVTATTAQQLREWAAQWPQRQWAVEGAGGLGRGLAQALAAAGKCVLDVPAQLAARARLLNSGHARKTDAIDATSVALVAVHHRRLRQVQTEVRPMTTVENNGSRWRVICWRICVVWTDRSLAMPNTCRTPSQPAARA